MSKNDLHTTIESSAEQDYLKQIFLLQEEGMRATTQALSERLGVKPPSVTAMIKHLADDPSGPFVLHTPYRGVELTVRGAAVALEMVRHHRLIELLLTEMLDVPWDRVHVEAERLEHVLSEDLEDHIAAKLGQPTRDPHGDPIPERDGRMELHNDIPLVELELGAYALITRVPDRDPILLHYLGDAGMVPGTTLHLTAFDRLAGVVTVLLDGGASHALGETLASRIRVTAGGRRGFPSPCVAGAG